MARPLPRRLASARVRSGTACTADAMTGDAVTGEGCGGAAVRDIRTTAGAPES
ncbi:hypothetical protein ACWEKM_36615 [Streptomyces sp. NPDC004752]